MDARFFRVCHHVVYFQYGAATSANNEIMKCDTTTILTICRFVETNLTRCPVV
jgi:hypothetical protein